MRWYRANVLPPEMPRDPRCPRKRELNGNTQHGKPRRWRGCREGSGTEGGPQPCNAPERGPGCPLWSCQGACCGHTSLGCSQGGHGAAQPQPLPPGQMPQQAPFLWAPGCLWGLPSSCPLLPLLFSISGLTAAPQLPLSRTPGLVWLLLLGGLEPTPHAMPHHGHTTPSLVGLGSRTGRGWEAQQAALLSGQLALPLHAAVFNKQSAFC